VAYLGKLGIPFTQVKYAINAKWTGVISTARRDLIPLDMASTFQDEISPVGRNDTVSWPRFKRYLSEVDTSLRFIELSALLRNDDSHSGRT